MMPVLAGATIAFGFTGSMLIICEVPRLHQTASGRMQFTIWVEPSPIR